MSTKTKSPGAAAAKSSGQANASQLIDQKIRGLTDWRADTLRRMRELILKVDPEIVEEIKWVKPSNPSGVPVWSDNGIICTAEVYKQYVKLTFAHGAGLEDPTGMFNASLDGGTRRAIDIREGEKPDGTAFKALVKAAVAHNRQAKKK